MRNAIAGARGSVGRIHVKFCSGAGHHTPQDTLTAFRDYDAVIHSASIPDPLGKDDDLVHNDNVNSAFNAFRAAAELALRHLYASSLLQFDSPIHEDAPERPTDPYAMAKQEAELQASVFARWFPGLRIACLCIHEVAPLNDMQTEHEKNWQDAAVNQLWEWVSPQATARACLLAVECSERINGCETFNIELARRYFQSAEIRGEFSGNQSFWATDKAERMLGWAHCKAIKKRLER
ncbi:hypothetical protein BDW66DRAFT_166748 [Aspergillus desertorum]